MTKDTKCKGPCSAKTKAQVRELIFNPDCPQCMRIWANFLDDKNLYVVTDKND